MRSRVIWRRSATAIGAYSAAALGFLTTVVATRELGVHDYAQVRRRDRRRRRFFQQLLDLTIEEALVKFGFRYVEAERWGRLRRLFEVALGFKLVGGVLAALAICALAPFAEADLGHGRRRRADADRLADPARAGAGERRRRRDHPPRPLRRPRRVPRRVDGAAARRARDRLPSRRRRRRDRDGGRAGRRDGRDRRRRHRRVPALPGGAGRAARRRRPRPAAASSFSSTLASSLDSARGTLGTSLVPTVAPIVEAGYFRNAQAPATGLRRALRPGAARDADRADPRLRGGPARPGDADAAALRRRHGRADGRRGAGALGPDAVPDRARRTARRSASTRPTRRGSCSSLPRCSLVWGWTKSFPVSIGRPGLRVIVQSVEIAVFVPLLLVFASTLGRDRRGRRDARLDGRSSAPLWAVVLAAAPLGVAPAEAVGELKILVVSGIWPPDVGGPASHAPEVAAFLRGRGHDVEVVITADAEPAPEAYPVHWVRALAAARVSGTRRPCGCSPRAPRRADVVYTTGMLGRSSLGSLLGRTPFVTKLTADPAYERARRWGIAHGSLEEFQRRAGRRVAAAARCSATSTSAARRTWSRRRRTCASSRSAGASAPDRVTLLPNPAPPLPELAPREELRARFGIEGPTLAFAGRLTAQKSLDLGIEAARRAGVALADRRRRARPGGARAARLRPLPRAAAAAGRARALPRRRRLAALVGLGELPAHGGRGARGRDARDRHAHRRRRRGARRRRERPRGRARRRGRAHGGDRALLRRGELAGAAAGEAAAPSVADYAPDRVYWAARADPGRGRPDDAARPLRRPDALPAAASGRPRAQVGRALGAAWTCG